MEFSEHLLGVSQSENDKIIKVSCLVVLVGSSDWNIFVGIGNCIQSNFEQLQIDLQHQNTPDVLNIGQLDSGVAHPTACQFTSLIFYSFSLLSTKYLLNL